MKVITLLNEKGGVGKTTLSTHIAAGLARNGYRVVLVDADAQANATSQLKVAAQGGLYDLLIRYAEWKNILRVPSRTVWDSETQGNGSLLVLPSNIETRAIPQLIDEVVLFQQRLAELEGYIDAVVIDTSPTPSLLHAMIYLASDYMLYPTQAELLSMTGVAKGVSHMKRSEKTRKAFDLEPTALLGVIPTMYQAQTVAHQHGLGMIKHKFGKLTLPAIAHRTIWREAAFARQTMFAYAPESKAALEMQVIVNHVTEGIRADV